MLNESKGNMYDFVTHTWNAIKGECFHDCSYCYMKRWGKLKPVRFDEKELKTDLGEGNFIFVGSSCDMFSRGIKREWIYKTFLHCHEYSDNKYFFQSKDPLMMYFYKDFLPENSVVCTTIESNFKHVEMGLTPNTDKRARFMSAFNEFEKYVTIEPIMDFDLIAMIELIKLCDPVQVNIGADSGDNNLPEPTWEKIEALISELEKFTIVNRKKNLKRLMS